MSKQGIALAKARERRRALDKARDEQDQRIEAAAAGALVAMEVRADAERALNHATSRLGEALKLLLAEDVSFDRAAALLDVDVTEVRRLVRAAPRRRGVRRSPESGAAMTASGLPNGVGDRLSRRTG